MRGTIVARLWAIGVLVVLHAPIQAQTSDSQLPVSLERIREGVTAPPPVLRAPDWSSARPTFRVEVRQPWAAEPIEEEPFDPTMGLPSAGELLVGGIEKIHSAAAGYKRRRAERRARREVQESLAAFCAVHECQVPDTRK